MGAQASRLIMRVTLWGQESSNSGFWRNFRLRKVATFL
jgi:hypothetical protein